MSQKDWMEKDYYKILGVSKNATPDEIKKAFRKLARENHPDQHPGDAGAEKRFKEYSEANSVLSDPAQRKEYDDTRSMFGGGGFRFPGGGGRPGAPNQGVNIDDLFRGAGGEGGLGDIFGGLFGGGQQAGATRRQSSRGARRGGDVEGEVTIPFSEAISGATVGVSMRSEAACKACHGTGAKAGTSPKVCPTCQGSGTETVQQGGFTYSETCPDCRGRGLVIEDPCPVCGGTGHSTETKTMQVRIPAGVTDGQKIRVKGKGGAGENGGAPGDLYVVVHVAPHPVFGRSGDNLTVTVPVTFPEAALGAEIEVPTLGGSPVRVRIPAGTPNGRTLRVRGRGVDKGAKKGDLLVTVDVQVPAELSPEATEALKAYAALAPGGNPRATLLAGV
ncbi:MAG TPA: molecular chaperone DnaJ [Propionibacteriaceae bacterium]|nr:molecular chaperone DnaJ [Propionibacteriaceae bacterium]HQE31177.1 molecular chaperone DnaJ [Propionibacteriaceae bacterium]